MFDCGVYEIKILIAREIVPFFQPRCVRARVQHVTADRFYVEYKIGNPDIAAFVKHCDDSVFGTKPFEVSSGIEPHDDTFLRLFIRCAAGEEKDQCYECN